MFGIRTIKNGRGKRKIILLLSLILIFGMSTWFSATAILPSLKESLNLSQEMTVWLTISVQIGFVVGALVSSILNLSDLILPRHIILAGAVSSAVANFLLQSVSSSFVAVMLRFGTGFFLAGVYPPVFKLMSTWSKEDRGYSLGVLSAAIVIGNGVPHLVNSLGGLDWRLVINITSGFTLVSGFMAEFLVHEGPYPFPNAKFDPSKVGQIISNKGVRLATIGYIGHMWELFALFAWYPFFFSDVLSSKGLPVGAWASFATFFLFMAGSFGSWIGGLLSTRIGKANTAMLMLAISGTCSFIVGFLFDTPIWTILLLSTVWGISVVADSAQFSALVTEYADQSYVGTALALQLSSGFTITVVSIWLIPLLNESLGWRWAFAFLAPGPLLGILAMRELKKFSYT